MTISVHSLRLLAQSLGFPDPNVAAAVAMAESGGDELAVGDSGHSFGLWQINHPAHGEFQPSLLLTPWYNGHAALAISKLGTDWQPWTTFRNGAYKKFLPPSSAPTPKNPPNP
jgi:Lysozyme like domain